MSTEVENHTLAILREMRREMADQRRDHVEFRRAFIGFAEQGRRIEARLNSLTPELEQMIRMELVGRLADFETRNDQKQEDAYNELLRNLSSEGTPGM